MPRYDTAWSGPDTANAEFSWEAPTWRKVLEIISHYEDSSYDDTESPFYQELTTAIPRAWISEEQNGRKRSFFRDSAGAWTRTGVLTLNNRIFRVTPLGRSVLSGQLSYTDLLLRTLIRHRENNGENPFAILAHAFLITNRPLTMNQMYLGVMKNYRPGDSDIDNTLDEAEKSTETPPGNSSRHFKQIIQLLEWVKAITPAGKDRSGKDQWAAWDHGVLQRLANSYQEVSILPENLNRIIASLAADLVSAGLQYDPDLVCRFVAALLTKPFVILTGLSGSGKTKLAQAFARWIAPHNSSEIVAVGADWTNSEQILGYPNALSSDDYVKTRALKVIIDAFRNPDNPYFLILDEMNLSHVERYFADILSAVESKEPMYLHSGPEERQGIPPSLPLPPNLFIIGTVNVDETTYMFSPKVLDRANTLEFRIDETTIDNYLNDPINLNLERLSELGQPYADAFVKAAKSTPILHSETRVKFAQEMLLFFKFLEDQGAEFGFRTASEMARYLCFYEALSGIQDNYLQALDAQLLQKLLPKLHGARRQLEPILCGLAYLCYQERIWEEDDGELRLANAAILLQEARRAAQLEDETLHPLYKDTNGMPARAPSKNVPFCLSYEKLYRMLLRLEVNGFTSFAEA